MIGQSALFVILTVSAVVCVFIAVASLAISNDNKIESSVENIVLEQIRRSLILDYTIGHNSTGIDFKNSSLADDNDDHETLPATEGGIEPSTTTATPAIPSTVFISTASGAPLAQPKDVETGVSATETPAAVPLTVRPTERPTVRPTVPSPIAQDEDEGFWEYDGSDLLKPVSATDFKDKYAPKRPASREERIRLIPRTHPTANFKKVNERNPYIHPCYVVDSTKGFEDAGPAIMECLSEGRKLWEDVTDTIWVPKELKDKLSYDPEIANAISERFIKRAMEFRRYVLDSNKYRFTKEFIDTTANIANMSFDEINKLTKTVTPATTKIGEIGEGILNDVPIKKDVSMIVTEWNKALNNSYLATESVAWLTTWPKDVLFTMALKSGSKTDLSKVVGWMNALQKTVGPLVPAESSLKVVFMAPMARQWENRDVGVRYSDQSTAVVTFLDGDDAVHPGFIEYIAAVPEEHEEVDGWISGCGGGGSLSKITDPIELRDRVFKDAVDLVSDRKMNNSTEIRKTVRENQLNEWYETFKFMYPKWKLGSIVGEPNVLYARGIGGNEFGSTLRAVDFDKDKWQLYSESKFMNNLRKTNRTRYIEAAEAAFKNGGPHAYSWYMYWCCNGRLSVRRDVYNAVERPYNVPFGEDSLFNFRLFMGGLNVGCFGGLISNIYILWRRDALPVRRLRELGVEGSVENQVLSFNSPNNNNVRPKCEYKPTLYNPDDYLYDNLE